MQGEFFGKFAQGHANPAEIPPAPDAPDMRARQKWETSDKACLWGLPSLPNGFRQSMPE